MRQAEDLVREDGRYQLRLSDGSTLHARTVVITTGATYRRLGVPALEDLQGRGVFYGAGVSEAPAMRGQKVFVVGGGNSAGQAAMHLAKWAAQVTVLVRSPSLTETMSDYLIREIDAAPNVDVRYGVRVAGGTGTDHLESLALEDTKTRVRRSVPADGLFVLIGSEPRTGWLGDGVARDRWGFILTGQDALDGPGARWHADRQPLLLETSLPGVFAAGDVRSGAVQRVASAVGEGAITIPLVHRYLEGIAVPETTAR
jgi:thioredoxin reductase (NADPH)